MANLIVAFTPYPHFTEVTKPVSYQEEMHQKALNKALEVYRKIRTLYLSLSHTSLNGTARENNFHPVLRGVHVLEQ